MECRHIIKLVPAGVPAGIIPHTVAAPAVIDDKFIDVITPVTHPFFFEYLFDEVDHVPCVVRPVIAAVDEKDIKFLAVKHEFLFVLGLFKFPAGTSALRAFIRCIFTVIDIPAYVALPGITVLRAGQFRIL